MQWEVSIAAATCAQSDVNDDVIGVNGWALSGLRPAVYTSRRALNEPEAFVVADGIQRGYGGLGAHLVAKEASRADQLTDAYAVRSLVEKLHRQLLAEDYFPRYWGITPDSFRLPGATVAGARVNPRVTDGGLLLFNVGDAAIFYSADGQRVSQQSITDRTDSGMLTQAIGGGPPGEPDVHLTEFRLAERNRILLCTDGLVDAVRKSEDIDRLVREAENPRRAVSFLVDAAIKNDMQDDVSALVLHVNSVSSGPSPARKRFLQIKERKRT